MNKTVIKWTAAGVVVAVAVGLGWYWKQSQNSELPEDLVFGNGRIEADQIDISSKYAGRVSEILAQEGALVEKGQLLAKMDTAELDAHMTKAKADLSRTLTAVKQAESQLVQRQSELGFAEQEYDRVLPLVKKGMMAQNDGDRSKSTRDVAAAAVAAAKSHVETQVQLVEAAHASILLIQTQINDSILNTPAMGRVLYKLAEPGEVLAPGGKVLIVLDLSEVYMEIFLPSSQASRLAIGAEARIKLDVLDYAIPAAVSFVSPEAQFTPKQVETLSEREKLMFRVKVRIPQALVLSHISEVKSGVRGVAYIRLPAQKGAEQSAWPEFLQQLPPDYKPTTSINH